MIQANELRIGNKLEILRPMHGNKYVTVESISDTEINIQFRPIYLKEVDPILLTEEILLKSGFKAYYYIVGIKGFEEQKRGYILNGYLLSYYDNNHSLNGGGYFLSSHTDRITFNTVPIISVHQLQNLHFALTGTELKINL